MITSPASSSRSHIELELEEASLVSKLRPMLQRNQNSWENFIRGLDFAATDRRERSERWDTDYVVVRDPQPNTPGLLFPES